MNAFVTSGSCGVANTLQTSCQLFLFSLLRILVRFPSIELESRPARLVLVVTDF